MATLDQVIAQIRFDLSQLRARNAHHEFEHLCRHYARKRICRNILPATGPVSTGGDQGRDFETFRTYIESTDLARSVSVGLATNKLIAFPCSLQQEGIASKVKDDVNTIMASGTIVDAIYYFCEADVPVGRRHKLEEWCRNTHSVEFVLHDGQALAENLAENDVFWIATRFLHVPSEIYPSPQPVETDDWYTRTRELWKSAKDCHLQHSDFNDIKIAIRHATAEEDAKQDIPFWIGHLERFIEKDASSLLARTAVYEIAVASLVGMGTLFGQESRLRQYFSAISSWIHPKSVLCCSP